jgi:glycosyltransferase involved in cell wall biosynthesis
VSEPLPQSGRVVTRSGVRYSSTRQEGTVDASADTRLQPLVSCIVPVFNGELYLREALDSALQQTYQRLEIIAVDDGSTDRTADILTTYADRVRALRQSNAGPAAARNRGLREMRGEFVAFLDADDLWHADKLTRQMGRFQARPELDICVTQLRNFWVADLRDEEARFRDHRIARPLPGYPTTLVRRRIFDLVGEFDERLRFGHSTEWSLRAIAHGAVVETVAEVLYYRRIHRANRSRLMHEASRDEHLRLVKAHLDRRRREQHAPAAGAAAETKPGTGR